METIKDRLKISIKWVLYCIFCLMILAIIVFVFFYLIPKFIYIDLLKMEYSFVGFILHDTFGNAALFGVFYSLFYWFRWLIIGKYHEKGFTDYFEERNKIKMKKDKQNGELSII